MLKINQGPEKISQIAKKRVVKKLPAYEWQDLALKVIADLSVPEFKRNSVFRVCKKYPRSFIEKCFNDTKELCQTGEAWRYFFKLTNQKSVATNQKNLKKAAGS